MVGSNNKLGIFRSIASVLTKFITPIGLIALISVVIIGVIAFNKVAKNKAKQAMALKEIQNQNPANVGVTTLDLDKKEAAPSSAMRRIDEAIAAKKTTKNAVKKVSENGDKKNNNYFKKPFLIKNKKENAPIDDANYADKNNKPFELVTNPNSITPVITNINSVNFDNKNSIKNNDFIDNKKPIKNDELEDNKNRIYQIKETDKITFKTSETEATKILCRQGTIMLLPPKAFNLPNNTPIELTVKEYFKLSDAILGNLNTQVSDDEYLVSGGMLFIEAKFEDKILKLNREAEILMPKKYEPSQNLPTTEEEIAATTMQLFIGDSINTKNNTFKWQLKRKGNSNFIDYRKSPNLEKEIKNLEKIYREISDLRGCDKMFIWKKYYNFRYAKLAETNKKIRLKDSMFVKSDIRPKGFSYVGINKQDKLSNFCKEIAAGADSVQATLNLTWEKRHKTLDLTIHEGMSIYSKHYVRPDFKTMSQRERKHFVPYHKLRQDIADKIAWLKSSAKMYEKEDKLYEKRLAAYKKAQKDIFSKDNSTKTLNDLDDLSYYIFTTSDLGYINCDYFRRIPPKDLVHCQTDALRSGVAIAKLIFKQERVILDANFNNNFIGFTNIAKNKEAILFVMKQEKVQKDGKEELVSYLAMQDINTSTPLIHLQFERLTAEALRAKIQFLDKPNEGAEEKTIQ